MEPPDTPFKHKLKEIKSPPKKFLIFWKTGIPKKSSYISGNGNPEAPFIFSEMELLSPSLGKIKKIHPTKISSSKIKNFLIFQEMELFGSNIKKFLIFSQKKVFLIFREVELSYILGNRKPLKKFLIIWETVTLKTLFIFQEVTFQARKVKRTHS